MPRQPIWKVTGKDWAGLIFGRQSRRTGKWTKEFIPINGPKIIRKIDKPFRTTQNRGKR